LADEDSTEDATEAKTQLDASVGSAFEMAAASEENLE
jgi:hypothetical protein|tara:strand:+ start:461 stop:571 length:111 start_codon:yes stop_codon:yes gene_type:complete